MTLAEGHVWTAFGLTFAAGTATLIGASVVFFPKLVKLASRRVLAGSLGFSASMMIYISFVDIFRKSFDAFKSSGMEESRAYGLATLCVFIGVLMTKVVEMIVHRLNGDQHPNRRDAGEEIQLTWNENEKHCEIKEPQEGPEVSVPHCVGCSADPVGDLKKWQAKADAEITAMTHEVSNTRRSTGASSSETNGSLIVDDEENAALDDRPAIQEPQKDDQRHDAEELTISVEVSSQPVNSRNTVVPVGDAEIMAAKPDIAFRAPAHSQLSATEEKKKLVRMGLTTATALAIHNFPEGLATFVAALEDPFSGAVLAIAIGAHNIPEGLCVALPIYYGTGSRWRGFFWGVVSGMAEPVAAILGWLVLATTLSLEVYAVLFGLVSGIMVMISLKELLPTAHRYDPEDAVVTYCAIVGMGVMALSLVLFKFST
ncbi:hypothetical protein HJC23_011752 [Cyclotella cryptica]|uniref:Zinc/iron permease n=1 Tax=Cyclotella cryptica TaxID=29204 RepID=A0ABD3PH56_9STRA